jgi:hypothetical protein
MNTHACEQVRENLPEWVAGGVQPVVDEHLAACPDCRAEAELLRAIRNAAPAAPAGLEARVLAAARARPLPRAWRSTRQLAVAATMVGAVIGGSLLLQVIGSAHDGAREGGSGTSASVAADAPLPVLDDPVVNGGSLLSSLTEAELEALLARMES